MECFETTDFDNNSRLIALSAIIISGLHCIRKDLVRVQQGNFRYLARLASGWLAKPLSVKLGVPSRSNSCAAFLVQMELHECELLAFTYSTFRN
jgi:hypothetical protein